MKFDFAKMLLMSDLNSFEEVVKSAESNVYQYSLEMEKDMFFERVLEDRVELIPVKHSILASVETGMIKNIMTWKSSASDSDKITLCNEYDFYTLFLNEYFEENEGTMISFMASVRSLDEVNFNLSCDMQEAVLCARSSSVVKHVFEDSLRIIEEQVNRTLVKNPIHYLAGIRSTYLNGVKSRGSVPSYESGDLDRLTYLTACYCVYELSKEYYKRVSDSDYSNDFKKSKFITDPKTILEVIRFNNISEN